MRDVLLVAWVDLQPSGLLRKVAPNSAYVIGLPVLYGEIFQFAVLQGLAQLAAVNPYQLLFQLLDPER